MRTLLALAVLLFVSTTSEALLVVYKGTVKITQGNGTSGDESVRTFFLVIDFNTLQGNMIFTQKVGNTKTIFDNKTRSYGIADIGTTPARTISLTSVDPSNGTTSTTAFTHIYSSFIGDKTGLELEAGTGGFVGFLPKKLDAFVGTSIGTPFVFLGRGSVKFDKARTQDYNATGKTVNEASLEIRGEYFQLGYTDTTTP